MNRSREKTPSSSGAELAAIWTEAALLAVRDNRDVIKEEDYVGGWQRVSLAETSPTQPNDKGPNS